MAPTLLCMGASLTLGHVRGIPVRAHFTLLIILPYLAFLMAARFGAVAEMAGVEAEAMVLPPLAWGLLLSVLLFACILAHELGHSLVALASGGKVSGITLMLLGGVSELHGLPKKPSVEAKVAIVGPLVSVALGAAALGLYSVLGGQPDLRFGLFYLGYVNLLIAAFNLLPAFPMDGGRVLRSLLATRLSRVTATRVAAATGGFFAGLFVIFGLLGGNLLLALIGLFVWAGARAETAEVQREEKIEGLLVRDVMSPARDAVDAWESVASAGARMTAVHATALPVLENGSLAGVIAAHHVEAVKPDERETTPSRAVAALSAPRLHAEEPLATALERMAEHSTEEAPVLDHGRLVGILDSSDLARALRMRDLSRGRIAPSRTRFEPGEAEVIPFRPPRRRES